MNIRSDRLAFVRDLIRATLIDESCDEVEVMESIAASVVIAVSTSNAFAAALDAGGSSKELLRAALDRPPIAVVHEAAELLEHVLGASRDDAADPLSLDAEYARTLRQALVMLKFYLGRESPC